MGFFDFFTRNFDEESGGQLQGSSRSTSVSTKMICQMDEEGKMRCKKYTTKHTKDPSDSWVEESHEEEVPYSNMSSGAGSSTMIFDEFDNMMNILKGHLHGSFEEFEENPRFNDFFGRSPFKSQDYAYPQQKENDFSRYSDTEPSYNRDWNRSDRKSSEIYDI